MTKEEIEAMTAVILQLADTTSYVEKRAALGTLPLHLARFVDAVELLIDNHIDRRQMRMR